jgi:SAM-dependent methyltransferase
MFDLVLALDVLEHLDRDGEGLLELARLVKPGGVLVVTVPALPSLWGSQDVVSYHHRRYTRRTIAGLFDQAGMRQKNVTYFNTLLFPIVAGVRWSRRIVGRKPAVSDFEASKPGLLNTALATVFGAERYLVGRIPMPAGVSLLATWKRPELR